MCMCVLARVCVYVREIEKENNINQSLTVFFLMLYLSYTVAVIILLLPRIKLFSTFTDERCLLFLPHPRFFKVTNLN